VNVLDDSEGLKKMLDDSGNRKEIPVIVEGDRVTIGYGGS
jgi:hypothetical protein